MALNAAVSPGFPWAIFPFGGWAIGLLEHFASVLRKGERAREIERMPHLDSERLSLFKQLQRKKDAIWLHLASTITTSAFLGAINFITSPQFPWALIPAGAMLIGLLSHAGSYAGKKRELERAILDSYGLSGSWDRALAKMPASLKEAPIDLGPYQPLVEAARSARAAIAEMIDPGKGKKAGRKSDVSAIGVDADLLPTVDSYVEQVSLLAKRTREVDRIIDLIPLEALRTDREALKVKLGEAPGEGLRREYEKSIAELDKQETSYNELKDQREVMELRLRSSVNTLKQMRIDLARLSGMSASGGKRVGARAARQDAGAEPLPQRSARRLRRAGTPSRRGLSPWRRKSRPNRSFPSICASLGPRLTLEAGVDMKSVTAKIIILSVGISVARRRRVDGRLQVWPSARWWTTKSPS